MEKEIHSNKCPALNEKECKCDGYHTFDELYEHRIALFIVLLNMIERERPMMLPWKSKRHSDGSEWEGWFIAGLRMTKGKQISYHLPIKDWDKLKVQELDKAPEWDGHTSDDVLERLLQLV